MMMGKLGEFEHGKGKGHSKVRALEGRSRGFQQFLIPRDS